MRQISRSHRLLHIISELEKRFRAPSDEQLRKDSLSLRFRAKCGEKLSKLVAESFALVREAARRTIEMRHFDVQVLGGIALARGRIAEMETGEGKTLTATLSLYLHALAGKGRTWQRSTIIWRGAMRSGWGQFMNCWDSRLA